MKKLLVIVITCLFFASCVSTGPSIGSSNASSIESSTGRSENCVNGKCSPGWITDENTGCKVWNPGPVPNETITWSGQCVNGFTQGKGILQWYKDGVKGDNYVGNYVDGKEHGKGKFTWANGDVYEGDWVDSKKHGKGKYIWVSGEIYEGGYVDNKRTGKGKFTWASGEIYEGDWVDDKRNGKGKNTRANGSVYEGDFVDDNFHGYGTKWYANGDKYTQT